ncbi:gamma-glutamyltranspeptidase [Geomicrobium halophilum]|uniref:Gamma-glutamyltranspeptidase n=1 Tax=Geomicrobium halophilum TaxID=549000 RepID=A0A841Q1Z8_9BACL|nr:gamma-glutamyltransferase [Geomicrobium halophilum]MBB6450138.1 gamma-glutamyltranspeptidase [Geomicrobium halophilum]
MLKPNRQAGISMVCWILIGSLFAPTVTAQEPKEPIPHVTGSGGAVASEDVHASKAGMTILEQGGNAIDAAIAVAAAQGVTRPYSGGIGGGGMMLIYLAEEDDYIAIDSRSITPASFNDETFFHPETGGIFPSAMRISGGKSFSVPGTVKNWELALEEYGTMTFEEVLQPAIEVAEEGFIVDDNFVRETSENQERFNLFTSTREIYLNEEGSTPEAGELIRNPDMAYTYQLLADEGADVFYEGEIAEAMVDTINHPPVVDDPNFEAVSSAWDPDYGVLEGNVTMEDFANYETVEYDPIQTGYRGYEIYGMPPSSSGGITIGQTLNMLEHYDLESMSETQVWHYFMEATRYAIADRREYIGDPAFTDIPVDALLSDWYTAERITNIHPERASIGQVPPGNPWPDDDGFFYDFSGEDGDEWKRQKFYRIDTGPRSSPFDTAFTIEEDTGRIDVSERKEGRGSAYGRAAANMDPIEDNELSLRMRADNEGYDQRLRLWLNGDTWQSGSSIPNNGYGVEINTETNELVLRRVKDRQLSTLARIDYPVTTDWHDLRFRVENHQLKINAWNVGDEEPGEWLAVHDLSEEDQLEQPLGRFMMSVINFDYEQTQTFFIDEVEVEPVTEESDNLADPEPAKANITASTSPPAETTSLEEEKQGIKEDEEERRKDEEDEVDESTIHLAVSDAEGNVVSYTTTIVSIGGNGMVVPGYGFLLNNAVYGRIPTESPSHPNYPRPGMRSMSSMAPTLVMEDDSPVLTVGAPGSDTILTTIAQILISRLDLNMSLPEAIEKPRLSQRNNFNALAEYEEAYLDEETARAIEDLEAMGHRFSPNTAVQGISAAVGIEFLEDGKVTPATEPERRGGGSAMVQSDSDEIRASDIKALVQQYADEGAFKNDEAVRSLEVHLTSVSHFEDQEQAGKVLDHMKGFKDLLDHQHNQNWISEEVFKTLQNQADAMIEKWQ